jgi:anti-sigma regulatory factor (Ser/Thr protein kinase)
LSCPDAGSRQRMTSAGSASGEPAVLDEGFDTATLHLLRERVAACATAAGMTESRAADIVLAVHELAANAVRHGAGTGRLLVRAARGALRCQVSDTRPGPEYWPLRQGHGLWIVREVADHVAVSSGPAGSAVTAVFVSRAESARNRAAEERPEVAGPYRRPVTPRPGHPQHAPSMRVGDG